MRFHRLIGSNWLPNVGYRVSPIRTGSRPKAVDRLAEITAPTLVIIGGRDVLDLRRMGETLSADIPATTRHLIDHVGHAPNLEDPALFNRLVVDFLATLPRSE